MTEQHDAIRTALGLSRSIAMAGEPWTDQAEQVFSDGMAALIALTPLEPATALSPGAQLHWETLDQAMKARWFASKGTHGTAKTPHSSPYMLCVEDREGEEWDVHSRFYSYYPDGRGGWSSHAPSNPGDGQVVIECWEWSSRSWSDDVADVLEAYFDELDDDPTPGINSGVTYDARPEVGFLVPGSHSERPPTPSALAQFLGWLDDMYAWEKAVRLLDRDALLDAGHVLHIISSTSATAPIHNTISWDCAHNDCDVAGTGENDWHRGAEGLQRDAQAEFYEKHGA